MKEWPHQSSELEQAERGALSAPHARYKESLGVGPKHI
jgi:hypothetical protein